MSAPSNNDSANDGGRGVLLIMVPSVTNINGAGVGRAEAGGRGTQRHTKSDTTE